MEEVEPSLSRVVANTEVQIKHKGGHIIIISSPDTDDRAKHFLGHDCFETKTVFAPGTEPQLPAMTVFLGGNSRKIGRGTQSSSD